MCIFYVKMVSLGAKTTVKRCFELYFTGSILPFSIFDFIYIFSFTNYLLTDKAYRFISSWIHPQCDPSGRWFECAVLKHEDPRTGVALCGTKISLATPGLREACCPDNWPAPGCIFHLLSVQEAVWNPVWIPYGDHMFHVIL